jgi:cardiolipin synthase
VLGAMRSAVARGVTVDLIVSKVVDQRIVNWSQSSYYDDLLAAGVRVNLFRDHLLHAKNVSIDGQLAVVGSSNVDLRSFQLNEEASLLLYDAPSIDAVEAIQRGYLQNSDRLNLQSWRARPTLRKLGENIARLANSLL